MSAIVPSRKKMVPAKVDEQGVRDAQLIFAATDGKVDEVRKLLQEKANPNIRFTNVGNIGNPLLLLVLTQEKKQPRYLDVVRALLEGKADVNAKDQFGNPIVHSVVKFKERDVLKMLMDHKVDLSGVDKGALEELTQDLVDKKDQKKE